LIKLLIVGITLNTVLSQLLLKRVVADIGGLTSGLATDFES
jgi:hypothetical protein